MVLWHTAGQTHGSLQHCTQFIYLFFLRPAGHSEVLSPFSIIQLFQDHSLRLASKISAWSMVGLQRWLAYHAQLQKEWLEERYCAQAGKELQPG